MRPFDMARISGRRRYDTRTSVLLAGDDYLNGFSCEREGGQNQFLYKSRRGYYFLVAQKIRVGESEPEKTLTIVSVGQAVDLFMSRLFNRRRSFDQAFPDQKVLEA